MFDVNPVQQACCTGPSRHYHRYRPLSSVCTTGVLHLYGSEQSGI